MSSKYQQLSQYAKRRKSETGVSIKIGTSSPVNGSQSINPSRRLYCPPHYTGSYDWVEPPMGSEDGVPPNMASSKGRGSHSHEGSCLKSQACSVLPKVHLILGKTPVFLVFPCPDQSHHENCGCSGRH